MFDHCPLLSQSDRNLDIFSRSKSSNVELLLQDETFLHDQHFLDDWNNEHVAFGTLLGDHLHFFANWHAGDFDLLAFQGGAGNLVKAFDDSSYLYLSSHDVALIDAQLLLHDRYDILVPLTLTVVRCHEISRGRITMAVNESRRSKVPSPTH